MKSFEKINEIKTEIEKVKCANNLPFVIVGTKTDLSHCRKVSPAMSQECAQKLVAAHFECSACYDKQNEATLNINEAFSAICRDLCLQRQNSPTARRRRKSSLSQFKSGFRNLVSSNRTKSHSVSISPTLPPQIELTQSSSQNDIYNKSRPKTYRLQRIEDVAMLDRNSNEIGLKTRRQAISSPNLRKPIRNSLIS